MTDTIHTITYTNEHGERVMGSEFSRAQALQMAANLLRDAAWGTVTSVTITVTDRPMDARSIQEIEAQVVA